MLAWAVAAAAAFPQPAAQGSLAPDRPDAIARAEAARATLRVPFFMYSGVINGVDFDAAQDALSSDACKLSGLASSRGQADVAFLRQLRASPWRVDKEEDADVIVMPVATLDLIEASAATMRMPATMSMGAHAGRVQEQQLCQSSAASRCRCGTCGQCASARNGAANVDV